MSEGAPGRVTPGAQAAESSVSASRSRLSALQLELHALLERFQEQRAAALA